VATQAIEFSKKELQQLSTAVATQHASFKRAANSTKDEEIRKIQMQRADDMSALQLKIMNMEIK